ncbi:MAG TPA: HEPN domain-containing protein [Pyrinomonadaceae bacterium]|jgi:hypothetical protein
MPSSSALKEFTDSLSIAEELLKIERGYSNPPKSHEQKAVQGLRGGVSVLVVASFERFLKECIEEQLTTLTTHPAISLNNLPDELKVCSTFNTLERAMKGQRFQKAPPKKDRLTDVEAACRRVISNVVNPDSFSAVGANPNSDRVGEMMKNLAIRDVFTVLHSRFERKWRKPVAHTFIRDKLDEIVNRRHRVAHTALALGISRGQLKESVRFLKILAELLDDEVRRKISGFR